MERKSEEIGAAESFRIRKRDEGQGGEPRPDQVWKATSVCIRFHS